MDTGPTGATALWLPGRNTPSCRAVLAVLRPSQAAALAADVEKAPRVPAGRFNCPADDGTSVRLYFAYQHGRDEVVDVPLSGCPWVTAPGRSARHQTPAIRREIRALAPPAWSRYLAG